MCKHTTRVPFHPNRMRSDAINRHPSQGVKRSSNNQSSKPAPASRKPKATKSQHSGQVDNNRRSPALPLKPELANPQQQRGQQSPSSHLLARSPKHFYNVNAGKQQGPKTSTPSKAGQAPPLAVSPSMLANNYAGAKFSDPPSPKMLPKPPTSWMMNKENANVVIGEGSCSQMTNVLKVMLNVQA